MFKTQNLSLVFVLLVFFSSFVTTVSLAQQIPDLSSLDVEELTDAQIESLIGRLEESGYSESQLEFLAKSRGMSDANILKLRRRINEIRSGVSQEENKDVLSRLREDGDETFSRQNFQKDKSTVFDPFESIFPLDTLEIEDEIKVFGLDFFEESTNYIEPSLNVAAPANYQIGPGDQLIIDIWGSSSESLALDVSPNGSIYVPNLGPLFVSGYSIEKAEKRIKDRLKSIYGTLEESSFAQVSLGRIRTITVSVIGEVANPGSVQMSAFGTVMQALQLVGGPTENGSFRRIQIYRNDKMIEEADLYDLLIGGTGFGQKLQDQDILLVPPYSERVTVIGAVKRPAIYEALKGESLAEVIGYSGGFNENAYKKSVSIRRNLTSKKTIKTIEFENYDSFSVLSGDYIQIGEIQDSFEKRVRVEGAVNHPGEFEIKPGMKLSQAIELAGGFRGDVYPKRSVVIREMPDLRLESISFSPEKIADGTFDLDLKEEDLVKVQSLFDMTEDFVLTIEGEVQDPGEYPFVLGMSVEDLIYLAGGFTETAAKSFVEVARRIKETDQNKNSTEVAKVYNFPIQDDLSLSDEGTNFTLEPFDLIVIRKSPTYAEQEIIEVEGQVIYPGKYVLEKRDERISDILNRAGGATSFAYIEGATLIRRTEYYIEEDEEDVSNQTATAAEIRKSELQDLFEKDSLVETNEQEFKEQEPIGIELEKILENPGSEYDLILKEGDVLSIPRALETVRVRGEALYPSTIRFTDGNSYRYYVGKAGGFTDQARKRKSYVIHANGSAQKTAGFLWFKKFPEVKPGSELIIPSKPEKRKLSPGEIISIATGIGTLAVIINNLTN